MNLRLSKLDYWLSHQMWAFAPLLLQLCWQGTIESAQILVGFKATEFQTKVCKIKFYPKIWRGSSIIRHWIFFFLLMCRKYIYLRLNAFCSPAHSHLSALSYYSVEIATCVYDSWKFSYSFDIYFLWCFTRVYFFTLFYCFLPCALVPIRLRKLGKQHENRKTWISERTKSC